MGENAPRRGGELRGRFLNAAREVLREPDTNLDLRKVAERVGKSRTAPYLAFGRTEEGGGLAALRLAVAAEGFRELGERMEEALRSSRDPEEGLREMAAAYLAFARDEPRLFRLMFGSEVARAAGERVPDGPGRREREMLREARARTESVFLRAIGMEEGGYLRREGGLSGEELSGAVWAILHGVAMLTIDGQWDRTRLGGLDEPEELAASTLRFLTTASSEEIRPARDALAQAKREKGMAGEGMVPPRAMHALSLDSVLPPGAAESRPAAARSADEPGGARIRETAGAFDARSGGSTIIRRARSLAHLMRGARILWIDDVPSRTRREAEVFTALGAEIERATETGEALAALERSGFDVILSDIARSEVPDAGVRALPKILRRVPDVLVIFYVGELRKDLGAPVGAFGITSDPEELVHLVFDALERRRL